MYMYLLLSLKVEYQTKYLVYYVIVLIPIYKCAVFNAHVHYVMCIPKVFMNCTICTHTFITRTYLRRPTCTYA